MRGNYKTTDFKFSGEEIGENRPTIFLQYEMDAIVHFFLIEEKNLAFASVIRRGDALQYYFENVRDNTRTCQEFKQLIQDRFNNRVM